MFGDRPAWLDRIIKPPDPRELVRKWQSELRKESRQLERTIWNIQREEKAAHKNVKEAAKRGDMASAKVLAKEVMHTRKAVSRMYTNKAQLIAMNAQLTEQLAMVKVAGTLSKSTEVMSMVNNLVKVPELNRQMQQMSKEMMKAGIIDEIMEDAMDSALDSEDMEDETDAEVDKVLAEVAGEDMAAMAKARIPRHQQVVEEEPEEAAPSEAEQDLQARLNAVRG